SFTAARRRSRAGAGWRAGASPSRTRTRARSPRGWSRTASAQRAGRCRGRTAAREKDQDGDRPEAGHEPEEGPQVLRVPVVVREEPAEDRVADVERERRAEERRGREIGRHEGEPREVGDGGRERHPIDRASGPSLSCRGRVETNDTHILKRLLGLGEERLGRLAEELLSNPRLAETFSTALQKAFEAKGRVDRNMQTVLGLLNMPSRADMIRLLTKLEA